MSYDSTEFTTMTVTAAEYADLVAKMEAGKFGGVERVAGGWKFWGGPAVKVSMLGGGLFEIWSCVEFFDAVEMTEKGQEKARRVADLKARWAAMKAKADNS